MFILSVENERKRDKLRELERWRERERERERENIEVGKFFCQFLVRIYCTGGFHKELSSKVPPILS
jgi:hypothetical protein